MSDSHAVTRRDVLAAGAVVGAATAGVVGGANDTIAYGVIGTGGRGSYLLEHLRAAGNGRCVAVCDLDAGRMERAAQIIGTNPAGSGACLAVATGQLHPAKDDSFLGRELKYARRWLYDKGVNVDDEDADLEVGLSNLSMREERRVYFSEIDRMGRDENEAQFVARPAKSQASYQPSLAAKRKIDVARLLP
jgi:hypothetical protein